MSTTVYLIRHSIRFNPNLINGYNTTQDKTIKNEKIVLSVEGERRAEILSNEVELQNLDAIYVSNCVRTLQTAKYTIEKQKIAANIDERFDERRVGIPNDETVKDWWLQQYWDENYKTVGGESQKEVRERFLEALNVAIDANKDRRIAIFSHGYAITFFMMKWCKFEYIEEEDNIRFTFKGKEFFRDKINAPDVFKLEFDDNKDLIDIKHIHFSDLPYRDGIEGR